MEIKNNIKIHNRFDIEIVDKNTGEVKQSLVSYNIVLSQMYTRLCGGLAYFVNIHFGSGTGTLSPSRTSLFTHLGTKAAVDEEIIKAIPLSVWKRKIVLNPEEYVGNTISEVGIAFGSTNTNLVTHSLLKDSEGNTISIVKTDVDVVTIYATVFVTFDTSNANLTYISMPSSNQLVNYLIGGSGAPTGAFSLNDTYLSSAKLGTTANVTWTSDTVLKQRKTNVPRFSTTVGNGHVKYLEFTNLFSLKLPSTGIFTGQSYAGVSIGVGDGVKKAYDLPSANIRNSSIVIKRNGLVVTNYINESSFSQFRSSYKPETDAEMVAISNDGSLVLVALTGSPFIRTYDLVGDILIQRPLPSELPTQQSIRSLVISNDNKVIMLMPNSTVFFCYDWIGSTWIKRPMPTTGLNGNIQDSCINDDGSVVAFATQGSPYLEVYDWNGMSWTKRPNVTGISSTANDCRMANNGNTIAVAHYNSPFISIYDWSGTSWTKRSTPPSFPTGASNMGASIEISQDGLFLIATSNNSPYFVMYDWDGTNWIKLTNPTGISTSYYGGTVLLSRVRKSFIIKYQGYSPFAQFDFIDNEWKLVSSINVNSSGYSFGYTNDGSISCVSSLILKAILFTRIVFDTPPLIGDVITADYTVDGVHKTDQYVIDTSFAIQFGEI